MPPGIMTLGQIRLAAQQRSDMVNSQFVTTQEWNSYINQSLYELYDLLIQKYGDDYYVAPPAQFATNGSTQQYPLPDGTITFIGDNNLPFVAPPFYKLLGVDAQLNSQTSPDQWITLKRFNFGERNKWNWPILQNFYGIAFIRYRIEGNNIMVAPLPNGGQVLRLWYIPRMVELVLDTDTADGVSGWTEYVIIDAAIKAMQKEESDVTVLAVQKMAMIERIEAAAENRDAGEAQTVTDSRRANGGYDGFGSNGSDWGWN
jgi:hypothetical protein